MLWYKGWLETRFKLLASLGLLGFILVSLYSLRTPVAGLVVMATTFVVLAYTILAGSGIAGRSSFRATKGSALFTASLPATRFRVLAVRAGLGWLEMAGAIGALCWGMWLVSPLASAAVTAREMFEYAGTLVACSSSLYSMAVLLSNLLGARWSGWGSMMTFGALWWLSTHTPLPASVDIVRAMGDGSPLIAHTMPLTAMAFSLALAAILFFAALKIVQAREY
jgi:hypothetical protein